MFASEEGGQLMNFLMEQSWGQLFVLYKNPNAGIQFDPLYYYLTKSIESQLLGLLFEIGKKKEHWLLPHC